MRTKLHVELLTHTPEPERAVAIGARLCYSKSNINDLKEAMTKEKSEQLIDKLVKMGHMSPFEHASFTFGVEGVSRALTHQLVRHRVASYSQQSQRYVSAMDFDYIIPASIEKNSEAKEIFEKIIRQTQEAYDKLNSLVEKEDARYVLPNAAETRIIITMNCRELHHFFKMRCCNRAQWEIREMAIEMIKLAKKAAPKLFQNCGPNCVRGPCTEGQFTCGKSKEVREFYGINSN